jgi:hypothetical protein
MAILLRALTGKGKALKSLAQVVKAGKNVRQVLKISAELFVAKRIKKFADLATQPKFQVIVAKFTRGEIVAYEKHLVPLGFPDMKVIKKARALVVRRRAVEVTADVTEVHQALEEHIDYLSKESFFQQAHREAKKQDIIGRSPEVREWYQDYAVRYGTGFSYTNMLKEGGRKVSRPMRGKMMFFRYRPDEIESTYDLYPLIFVLNRGKDYFDGINFHYLVPKMRAMLLGDMFSYLSNLNFDISTHLNFKQFLNAVNTNKKFKFGKQALRRYNYKNIKSKIINVHPLDWELAIMVETAKFFNEKDSRTVSQQIWKETRMKAQTN